MKPDVFLFDGDGVLIRPWGFARALEEHHCITREHTREFFAGPFSDCLIGAKDLRETLPAYLEAWGWKRSVSEFIDFWLEQDDNIDALLLGHVKALRASGARCYVASNQEVHRARYMREAMGFGRVFDGLFFSCELGVTKPRSGFFDAIAEQITHEPGRLMFWDDDEANVSAARAAGWQAEVYLDYRQFNARMLSLRAEG